MSKNVRTQIGKVVGKSLDAYHKRMKPTVDELKFKEQYQGRIIDCMVGEVDDNYIETPETDASIVKLEHSKEGVVKIPSIKGKTILVDADGNETDTPAEGCRLVSVGEEDNKLIILSKNKNLLTSKFENGNMGHSGAEYDQAEYIRSNTYNKCSENMNIIVSYNTVFRFSQLFFFDENKNFLKRETAINPTVPKGAKYFRVVLAKKDGSLATNNDLELANSSTQVEFNTKSTSYVPHKQHKTEILLKEPLRSLPNGVCDKVVGNKLIRRIGKVVLDGKNLTGIGIINDNVVDVLYFEKIVTNKKFINYGIEGQQLIKSNIYRTGINANNWNSTTNENTLVNTISSGFWIFLPKFTVLNIEDAINYMNDNPTEVIYELEEPIIEELPNSITLQGFDDTTMYIENSIIPTVSYGYNALIPYKQELSNQKEEVEINTLDIENNIIPYLMNMEFNLMTMEDK